MELKSSTKLSPWFWLINLMWIFIFSIFGIIEAGGGPPTLDKILRWESLMVLGAPILITLIFYLLFNKIKWWLVFVLTFFLGALMSIEVILQYNSGKIDNLLSEVVFTILIWPFLIMIPYFLTKLAMRSKIWLIIIIILLAIFLTIQCFRLA